MPEAPLAGKSSAEFTALLNDARRGAPAALEAVFEATYAELRRIAGAIMRSERPGHTLQPIEGLHHGTVLLQIGESIKAVRISVELVADWRAFGAWAKSFEFVYTLPRSGGE